MTDTGQQGARPDLGWGTIRRASESGSFIEDRLAARADQSGAAIGRFRVDVMYIEERRAVGGGV
jgi:hypothetical protein